MKRALLYFFLLSLLVTLPSCQYSEVDEAVDVSVFVENDLGQPINGVFVNVTILEFDEVKPLLTDTIGCAKTGGYGLSEGGYKLDVSAQGYKPLSHTFEGESLNYFVVTLVKESSTETSSVVKAEPNENYEFDKCPATE
ncbi:MAG: hypothetical protein ACRCYY_04755 [Trueperaceae bacterium]